MNASVQGPNLPILVDLESFASFAQRTAVLQSVGRLFTKCGEPGMFIFNLINDLRARLEGRGVGSVPRTPGARA
ncbi:unnamed protein product [Brugia pahangi]|uniref:STAS domain-containing protein n=1 Tax=Brugia pahangi TaxID=6280 RepID=A0A0N4TUH2_BRUPA|nr:unnamed protein product [Brugia pahangi]